MSDGIDKICFAYPTLFKESMGDGKIYEPDLFLKDIDSNAEHTIVISAGLMMVDRYAVYTSIDLLFEGRVVTPNPEDDTLGLYENFKSEFIGEYQGLFISSMHIHGVRFFKSGVYEIKISIIESDTTGRATNKALDTYSSYFYVTIKEES